MFLSGFHPLIAEWFQQNFAAPTDVQTRAWIEIAAKKHTLIAAPTGSGKTLAAFLAEIDRLVKEGEKGKLPCQTRVVYVSPLKALSNDIARNLEAPLKGIGALLYDKGSICPPIIAAVRTGDTTPAQRTAMLKNPPHIW